MTRNDDADKEELRQRCLNMVEGHRDEITALGEEAYEVPGLGYKEFRTGKLMGGVFHKLGLEPEIGASYAGCRVSSGPKGSSLRVAMVGELDCIMCNTHPDTAEGGLIHACGHNIQLANLHGIALGILTSSVTGYLGDTADFIVIPAEECVNYRYKDRPMSQGTIHYLGEKQELMYCGGLDGTDMVLQCHMVEMEPGKYRILDTKDNGLISKTVHFLGRATHAGFALKQGVNTLNMVELVMNNIHVLGEAFRDEDKVRVSTVIKEDGSLANMVPGRVTMEIMACAFTIDAMEDTPHKVNRSIKAATMVLGGEAEIHDCIGYLPLNTGRRIARPCRDSMTAYGHMGEDAFAEDWETVGSTDLGDISQIMLCMHIWAGGIKDDLHTKKYRTDGPYTIYIIPAKMMAPTIINLLWDEGARGKKIMGDFRPALTEEEHLNLLKDHQVVDLYDASDL